MLPVHTSKPHSTKAPPWRELPEDSEEEKDVTTLSMCIGKTIMNIYKTISFIIKSIHPSSSVAIWE